MRAFLLLGEIAFFGGMTIVYKSSTDLFLYVVGSSSENEVSLGGWVARRVCPGVGSGGSGGGKGTRMGLSAIMHIQKVPWVPWESSHLL